jgi:hypothetical protein
MRMRKLTAVVLMIAVCGQLHPFAQASDEIRLPDGTAITVRLMEQLSSETAKTGDIVMFEVVEDVIVDQQVVIRQGTPARGTIVEAVQKRRMGRAGRLAYSLMDTKSVERQTVRLRATQEKKGGSNVTATAITTTAVAVFVPVAAPFFLLRKGKDVTVPQGARVDAFVDGDHVITAAASPTTEQPSNESPAPLTNADVVRLLRAGFGEDVVIAKIRGSSPTFSLETTDLLELKNAGVSDRVIEAMLQESKSKQWR